MAAALEAAGIDDVTTLFKQFHATLARYYELYREKLKSDRDPKGAET